MTSRTSPHGWLSARRAAMLIAIVLFAASCGDGENGRNGSNGSEEPTSMGLEASQGKIIHGTVIDPNALPSSKMLVLNYSDEEFLFCSGTFINDYQMLTAGHCTIDKEGAMLLPSDIVVRMSETEANRVVAVNVYPAFNGVFAKSESGLFYLPGDLAIITVENRYAGPWAVISLTPPALGQSILIQGWGKNDERSVDGNLRAGVNMVELVSPYEKFFASAFNQRHESSICQGDSGGGAFIQDASGALLLVGVNSSLQTKNDCGPGTVSVYATVADNDVLQWIYHVTYGYMSYQ